MRDEEYCISFNGDATSPAEVDLQALPLHMRAAQVQHKSLLVNGGKMSAQARQKAPLDRTSGLVKQKPSVDKPSAPGKQKPPLDRVKQRPSSQKPPSQKPSSNKFSVPVKQKPPLGKTAAQIPEKPSLDKTVSQVSSSQDRIALRIQQESSLDKTAPQVSSSQEDIMHTNSHDPILKRQHVAEWLFQSQHQAKQEEASSNEVHREEQKVHHQTDEIKMPTKRTVYLSDTFVQFPETKVGAQAMVKVRLCNRDIIGHNFVVLKPSRPFSVSHINFEIG